MEGTLGAQRAPSKCPFVLSWKTIIVHSILAAVLPWGAAQWFLEGEPRESGRTSSNSQLGRRKFPQPKLHRHKTPPDSTYSGQCVDDPLSKETDRTAIWSQHRVDVHLHIEDDHLENLANMALDANDENETLGEGFDGYQPAGQHMLMDIQNVDPEFLLDMEGMANAMVQVTTQSGLTLLSYHCHDLHAPMGLSCVGVLLESHVSIHTWPQAGILSLDLFTCGPASLLPLVPLLESLFVRGTNDSKAPRPVARWLYKKRGYRDYQDIFSMEEESYGNETDIVPVRNAEGVELEWFLLGWKGYRHKEVVVSTETSFQEVAVFEMSHSHVPLSREPDASMKFNKKLYLDDVAQSSLHGLEAYHEALVHPAMLTHEAPERVAIIGGGEGATLREVLKHNTVKSCTMLEIDAELVELSREYLKEWNDCSDFASSPGSGFFSCFDDPRARVNNVDAFTWIMERFGEAASIEEEKFDVIIMDALDPSSLVPFSDVLYGNDGFVEALVNALSPSGILVAQVGIANDFTDDGSHQTKQVLDRFTALLDDNDAEAMKTYSEAHGQFLAPWEYRVVFMDGDSKARWYAEPSWVDLQLTQRAVKTKSGNSPFKYIDGATHQTYQYPSRIEENVFCASKPTPELCGETRSFDPDVLNIPVSSFEVAPSRIPNAGRGVFFRQAYPRGSYLTLDDGVQSMFFSPFVYERVYELLDVADAWSSLESYLDGYGFTSDFFGFDSGFVDPGIHTFINHGCNGTNNIGDRLDVTELDADPNQVPTMLGQWDVDPYFFDPVADRTHLWRASGADRLLRDVEAGEEVLDNYLSFSNIQNWRQSVEEIGSVCRGETTGRVTEYESESEGKFAWNETADAAGDESLCPHCEEESNWT